MWNLHLEQPNASEKFEAYLNAKTEDGLSAVHLAVLDFNLDCLKRLADLGADIS